MKRINTDRLEKGLLVTGRNNKSVKGKLIRAGVHSFSNHNAMTVFRFDTWGIAEAQPPVSTVTSISDYERIMNEERYLVRFYRHKLLTPEQRNAAADHFVANLLNLPYPQKGRMALLCLPLYNALVDRTGWLPSMRMTWCSQLDAQAYLSQNPDCLDGFNGKKKQLFTPKTFENRIMYGLFEDVTDQIIMEK